LGASDVSTLDYPIIDAGVVHDWASVAEIAEYLDPAWRQYVLRPWEEFGPLVPRLNLMYPDVIEPDGGVAPAWLELEDLRTNVLDGGGADRAVLLPDADSRVGGVMQHGLARALARAVNERTVHEWLDQDWRLFGIAVVPNQVPEDAAEEIRRIGAHPQIVAVSLGTNTLGRKFGHPVYNPVYEAAAELGLPLVLQLGSDASALVESFAAPTGGGAAATHGEWRALGNHSHMSHVASLIYQGVFVRYPGLKLLLIGGGAAWIPGYLARLDYWHKALQLDVPWLDEQPSETFLRQCRVTTWGLESPADPERLVKLLSTLPEPGASQLLIYTSRYPKGDAEPLESLRARLPESWHRGIFRENAESFFRWPPAPGSESVPGRSAAVS
jgi:predicted TIM-barrel fold metal-dependent hydrolase